MCTINYILLFALTTIFPAVRDPSDQTCNQPVEIHRYESWLVLLVFCGVWSFLSVDAAVVCCFRLLKFITHTYAAALEGSLGTLWYYAAQSLIYESSVLWKPLSRWFSWEWPCSPTHLVSGTKLPLNTICDGACFSQRIWDAETFAGLFQ